MISREKSSTGAARAQSALYVLLWPHKEAMAKRWSDVVHGTYPFETVGFLRTVGDRFTNPVGFRTEEAAKALMEAIFAETPDEEAIKKAVDEIIRVRAIQDFPPETAVGVFFAMKDIIRDVVRNSEDASAEIMPALWALESRIDAVALLAFGAYARSRETLHRLRVEETKRQYSQLLRLAEKKAANSDSGSN
jgi:hypothetical protein